MSSVKNKSAGVNLSFHRLEAVPHIWHAAQIFHPIRYSEGMAVLKKRCAATGLILFLGFLFKLQALPAEIYLLRHAEKAVSQDKDPALSPCGMVQAQAMAKLLPHPVAVIYHSGYRRTQQTAEQIAFTQPDATLLAYNAADLTELAARLEQHQTKVVIVGHSNTTPELLHRLSKLPAPQMKEQDYGVIYQLKHSAQGYQLTTFHIEQPHLCLPH